MNMEHVTEVNGVLCEMVTTAQIKMYGRKKMVYWKSHKMVENHVLNGKWTRTIIGHTAVFTPANEPSKWKMLVPIMAKCALAFMIVVVASIVA